MDMIALAMAKAYSDSKGGYAKKKTLTFNGDAADKYVYVYGSLQYVQMSDTVIDAKTVTKITAMIGGVSQEFPVAETQVLTENVMLVYVSYGGSIVPAVAICTENVHVWKKGVSVLYDPNGDFTGIPMWISLVESETVHPIDPKYLPPVDREGMVLYTEQTLTEEQKAQARANIGVDESGNTDSAVLYTEQKLTDGQKAQARTNIGAVSIEEVEEMLGIEEEFSISGELVEFDIDVEPDTELAVISKIHRDETWGLSNTLVLHQVSSSNFVDLTSFLGGVGTVFEKNGLTATVNADCTLTVKGTNSNTDWTKVPDISVWYSETSLRVYPAGTYIIPTGLAIVIRKAECTNSSGSAGVIAGLSGNLTGKIVVPEPFRVIGFYHSVAGGKTEDVTIPLGIFRSESVPETGYEYTGNVYTATFDDNIYNGEYNWTTGELKDADGNTVAYYEPQSIKRLSGVNYFWTGFGENTVSNASSDLGKVTLRMNETAPENTIPSICDFMFAPTTPEAAYGLYYAPFLGGGEFSGDEVPVLTTKGTLSVRDADGNVKYGKYVEPMFNTRGVSDVLTHKGLEKKWSKKFYLNKEPVSITNSPPPYSGPPEAYVFVWEFDESEFVNTGIPAKIHDIPMASPCFINNDESENNVNTQTLWNGTPYPAFFSYNEETGKYTLTARGIQGSSIKYQLTHYSKVHFYYQLETPYNLPFAFAMGIDAGDTISFEADLADNQPYIDVLSGFKNRSVEPTITAFVPRNVEDAMDGMNNAARMLNTANTAAGGDATVQGYSWIGEGDGVTDYTVQIQSKLDELHSVSNGGTVHLGNGTYPISRSLIVYDNTRIIGDSQTIIEQTADNTHAIIISGSNIALKDFNINIDGSCTEVTACVFINSQNTDGANGYPNNYYVQNLSMDNITMSGKYHFEYENGKPFLGDVYNNYRGVGIYAPRWYFNYAHIDNVHGKYLMTVVHNSGGTNYFNIASEFCKYGVYIDTEGNNNIFFVTAHPYYAGNNADGYVSMSDEIVHAESGNRCKFNIASYDIQHLRRIIYFGGRTQENSYTLSNNYAISIYSHTSEVGDVINGATLREFVVDLGRGNINVAAYQNIPFAIGNSTRQLSGQSSMAVSEATIRNALSGAGVWGNISSNVAFDNCGLELAEVCRYPSEKSSDASFVYLPYTVSRVAASESNPVEIVIDISNRPIYAQIGYFIQFDHRYVASDFTVSYDTNGDGLYDSSYEVKDNTNVTTYMHRHQDGSALIHRIKFTFTKPLQIENFNYTDSGGKLYTINYNPDGLIGICNIGMTVNDYAGRSFLGECGGSLYGNVDMHQNTLKNLPDPIDDGDAVSKAYLEESLQDIEAALDAIIAIQNELIGGDDV